MDLLLVLAGILFLLVLWLLTRRKARLPPGPPRWPIVGNVFSLDADPRVTFSKLRQKYGDIFSVYMFHKPLIVLNGYDVLKDALVKHAYFFSDRLNPHLYTKVNGENTGIVLSSGSVWQEQRRFALTTLRDLGMGKSVIEDKIQEELVALLQALEDEKGRSFDPKNVLQNAVSNLICSIVFGKRFEYDDPNFQRFLKAVEELFIIESSADISNIFPSLVKLPGDLFNIKAAHRLTNYLRTALIGPSIDAHVTSRADFNDDFIAAYVNEMERNKDSNTSFNKNNLIVAIFDLFTAGTETTSTALRWTIAYFLNYPEVQRKCFHEIKENIGLNRPPSMKDKTSLPYLEATINEVLRRADLVPLGLPHSVSEDVEFRGYVIPKGASVIPMLNSVLQDPKVWGDPENFRPERFLNSDGKFQKRDELIPFGLGRRICIGESLARMELFLFLASMIQRFEFIPADGDKPPLVGRVTVVHAPEIFKVIAKVRD